MSPLHPLVPTPAIYAQQCSAGVHRWLQACQAFRSRRAIEGLVALSVLLLGACSSPMGPIPGGKLEGEATPWPEDWTFTDSIENVLLETDPMDPYSVTIWCVTTDNRLFIAAESSQSRWVKNIDRNNAVILGIKQWLYKAYAMRISPDDIPAEVADAYVTKYDRDPGDNFFEDGGVIIELVERQ